jgi:RNA polymerase sigma-70 factor (ECF subfamily)
LNATPTTASATGAGESSRPLSAATNAAATGSPESAAKLPALSGELKLLASAQQALRDDQLPRALTLLNEHATRYPRGALRPERLAARAVALCRMGEKNAGRAEAQKLATETPSSPLIRWARSICGL